MKTIFLFPNKFKLIGYALFIPSAVLGLLAMYNDFTFSWLAVNEQKNPFPAFTDYNYTNELALTLIVISLIMIAFSREKLEDEYVQSIRSNSLVLAIIINYIVLLIGNLTFYGFSFLEFMTYNLFTPLIVYIIVFNYKIIRDKQLLKAESNGE